MRAIHTCWFSDEGEDKGDDIVADSPEQAAQKYFARWEDDADDVQTVFIRSPLGVTEWLVNRSIEYRAVKQPSKET